MAQVQPSPTLAVLRSDLQTVASALHPCHAGILINLDLAPSSAISILELHMENQVSKIQEWLKNTQLGHKISQQCASWSTQYYTVSFSFFPCCPYLLVPQLSGSCLYIQPSTYSFLPSACVTTQTPRKNSVSMEYSTASHCKFNQQFFRETQNQVLQTMFL